MRDGESQDSARRQQTEINFGLKHHIVVYLVAACLYLTLFVCGVARSRHLAARWIFPNPDDDEDEELGRIYGWLPHNR